MYSLKKILLILLVLFLCAVLCKKTQENFNSGNQKKVALAKLITCQSNFWLLDEVDTNLDEENKKLLMNLIVSQADSGGIVFISSHNNPEIKTALIINMSDYS